MSWPPCPYTVDEDWQHRLREMVGAPWSYTEQDDFWALWRQVTGWLQEHEGLTLGRGACDGAGIVGVALPPRTMG
jgi:hypothetical protein